jgi:hypothetical protein
MTITSNILRRDYTANGVNTTFAFDFPIFYETNSTPKFSLEVIITDLAGAETTKIETTDYTITYNTTDYVNGVINQGNVVLNTAPILNYKVSILRKLNFTQNTDITTSGSDALPGTALEGSLDKLTLINLEIKENLNRVVRLPKSSSLTNIEFPIGSSQANQLIAINNDGTNLTTKDLADVGLAPVSTYIKTLLDDTTALQARTTLDAQQLNANLTALAGLTGASNKLFYFTGSGAMALQDRLATTTTQGVSYLNNPITIANNATTPNTKIDFGGGVMNFHDGSGQATASPLTKILQSSGSWTAGNDQNGLFSGAKANSTWYFLFAIYNPTTGVVDFGFDTNITATNRPVVYTKYQLLHASKVDVNGNILAGTYFKDGWFWYNTRQGEYDSTAITNSNLTLGFYPPNLSGFAHFTANSNMGGSTGARRIRIGASASNFSIDTGFTYGDSYVSSGSGFTSVNSSNQVYIITNGTGSSQLYINGFKLNI